jgi:hypothetical protein
MFGVGDSSGDEAILRLSRAKADACDARRRGLKRGGGGQYDGKAVRRCDAIMRGWARCGWAGGARGREGGWKDGRRDLEAIREEGEEGPEWWEVRSRDSQQTAERVC